MPRAPYFDVSFKARQLIRSFERNEQKFGGRYPEVRNPGAVMNGVRSVLDAVAKRYDVDRNHIKFGIIEAPQSKPQYVISVDETTAQYGQPGYLIQEIHVPTQQAESMSFVSPGEVQWLGATADDGKSLDRTKYYLGFIYMVCEKSQGFDQELIAAVEISPTELISRLNGAIPQELQSASNLEQEEKAKAAEQPAGFASIFSGWDMSEVDGTEEYEGFEEVAAQTPAPAQQQPQQEAPAQGQKAGYPMPWEEQTEEYEEDLQANFSEEEDEVTDAEYESYDDLFA